MTPGIGRAELQRLADEKLADAEFLCSAGRFSNAYYLAGYAVEIGLKAVIARQIAAETLPDPRFVRSIYTHALTELVVAAGMTSDLKARAQTDPLLNRNWATVIGWSEAARYRQWDGASAQAMIEAVGSTHGVLPWIRSFW